MFEKQFELRYFEMEQHAQASPVTIMKLLEETAADHCLSIEYSLYDLLEQNIGWVLLSSYMKMTRYPSYKEKITIRTWLSQYKGFRGIRENVILDEKGETIGVARGFWLFFDIEHRRPVKIFDDIINKWNIYPQESTRYDIKSKIEPIVSAKYVDEFLVRRFDLDTNKHVSNLRYLQWAMESIPKEVMDNCFLQSIDGRFVGEAQYGHTIESLTEPGSADKTFTHTIRDIESKHNCSIAKTVWVDRL